MTATTLSPRRALRVAAMQALFQLDVQGGGFQEQLEEFLDGEQIAASDRPFVRALVQQAWGHRPEVDRRIAAASRNWTLDRIMAVDRAILRLALGEILFGEGVPPRVAINEALELARVFGTADSPGFVNGLLDAAWKSGPPGE